MQTRRQEQAFERMLRANENRPYKEIASQRFDDSYWEETPQSLLSARDFYRQLAWDFGKAGLVGERRNALATWLIMTSRVLKSPLNEVVKGGSSAGKNHLVKTVLKFFPDTEIVRASSLSKRAINYMGPDALKHKILYIDELASITHPARQLISEGRIIHYVTAMEGGERVTKQIVTEGPVACITTTTKNVLQIDDESRNFSLWINQSQELTKAIGKAYVTPQHISPDRLKLWHGVQTQIARLRGVEVRVPKWFEDIVEKVLPYGELRIRRYWPAFVEVCKLLRLIREAGQYCTENSRERLTVEFDDFAAANCIFDRIISNSLTRSGSDEDLATADLVGSLCSEKLISNAGVSASDLVGQPGIRSLDRAYLLLRRAEHAGTILRSDPASKNNEKHFIRTPEFSAFLGNAELIATKIGLKFSGSFMDPIHGKWVYYGDQ